MIFQIFLGLSFFHISYFILKYNKIPDALYYQPILSQNAKYLVSSITLLFGMYCLFIAYKIYIRDKNKPKLKKLEHSKCPNCKESFNYAELKNGKCKYCDEKDTIEIDEYYKKYPEELKDT